MAEMHAEAARAEAATALSSLRVPFVIEDRLRFGDCVGLQTRMDRGVGYRIGRSRLRPTKLGGLSDERLLVQAHDKIWGQLIFKGMVKFD